MTFAGDPQDLAGVFNALDERVRALERLASSPSGFGILQAKGDLITATGPGQAVRFAAGPDGDALVYDHTTSTGLKTVPFPVLPPPGARVWWDAIVNPDLPSDPVNNLFQTVFEALPHYGTLGQATFILVDENFSGIRETVDALGSVPGEVTLVGFPAAGQSNLVDWNMAGFQAPGVFSWNLRYISLTTAGSVYFGPPKFGSFIGRLELTMIDCALLSHAQLLPVHGEVDMLRCIIQNQADIPASQIYLSDCDIVLGGAFGGAEVLGAVDTSSIVMDNVLVAGTAGTFGVNINSKRGYFYGLTVQRVTRQEVGGSGSVVMTLPAGFTGLIIAGGEAQDVRGTPAAGLSLQGPGTPLKELALYGHFQSVNLPPVTNGLHGDFSVSDTFDIAGPSACKISKLDGVQAAAGVLRGAGNVCDLTTEAGDPSAYTTLTLIGATDSVIRVASQRTAASGTQVPYQLDPTSTRNIIDFAGASTYPAPGVDLGSGNMIRTDTYGYRLPARQETGTTYTFALSDVGTVVEGDNAADTNFATLGQTGGEDTHVLTEAELAAHTHTGGTAGQSADHTHPFGTTTDGSHSHSVAGDFGLRILITFTPTSIQFTNSTPSGQTISYASLDAGGDHSHTGTTTGTSNDHTHAIPSDGSNTPHNNIQPYCTLNWIIKL